jgi:hypothetical protein
MAIRKAGGTMTASRPKVGTRTAVVSAAVDTSLLALSTSRYGATVFNDTDKTLYLALGTVAASTSSYTVQVPAGGYYEVPFGYCGAVRGIWATAPTGNAVITELT